MAWALKFRGQASDPSNSDNCLLPSEYFVHGLAAGDTVSVEWDFDLQAVNRRHVINFSATSYDHLRIDENNVIHCGFTGQGGFSGDVFTSPAQTLAINTRYKIRLELSQATQVAKLYFNDVEVASYNNRWGGFKFLQFGVWAGYGSFNGKLYGLKAWKNGQLVFHIDPSASGGTGNKLIDVVGGLQATQNGPWPSDNSEYVWYNTGAAETSKVGLGWGAEANYTTLRLWHDARKTATGHQTALCKGALGNSFVSMASTDYPAGCLIAGDVEYDGTNHSALAALNSRLDLASSSGLVVAQDLRIYHSTGTQQCVSASNNNKLLRCYLEHGADPGSNAAVLMTTTGGLAENCVARCLLTTATKVIRPSSTGKIKNCVSIGGSNGILTEWTNSEIRDCYAVDATTADRDYWFQNGRPAATSNLAASDASTGADASLRNLLPEDNFVDYANGDYRIKTTSPLYAAGIGAFFEESGVAQPEEHTAGTIENVAVDFIAGGIAMQKEQHVSGAFLESSADFLAGGNTSQKQAFFSGAVEITAPDFISGGAAAQRERFNQGSIVNLSAQFTSGGNTSQRERYTAGAIESIPASLISTSAIVMQRERFTQGALLAASPNVISGGAVVQRERYAAGSLNTITAEFITGGFTESGESHVGGNTINISADFMSGGTVAQRERFTHGVLLTTTTDFAAGGTAFQRERHTGGSLLSEAVAFEAAGAATEQRERFTAGALLSSIPELICDGFDNSGQHISSGTIAALSADFAAGGMARQVQGFSGGATEVVTVNVTSGGEVAYAQLIESGSLLPIACDFLVDGQFNQQFNYSAGSVLQLNTDFMAGGKVYQAVKKLRHSGHYVWNNQTKKDQQEYVRQSPDSFTGLLYVVRDAAPVTPDPDQWREDALFAQPDVNQRVTEYADPVVCYVLERPRESLPFDLDAAGENLINEHEDYLTVCVDTDVPTGSALEFEDDLGMGETRRSWWYVHHSTSLGTTAAGAVYYLIPLRDFTGVN